MASIFDSIHFSSETIHPSSLRRSSRGVTAAATIYDDADSSPQRTIAFIYEPSDSEEGVGHLIAYSTDTNSSGLVEVGSCRIPNGSDAAITVTPRFVKDTAILLLLCVNASNIMRFQVIWHPEQNQISFVEANSFSPGPTAEIPTSCEQSAFQMHPFHRVVALVLQSKMSESVLQLVALRPTESGGDTTKLLTTMVVEGCRCGSISWSPNGEYLAISSNSDATVGKEEVEANVKLCRYDPLDSEQILRMVTTIPKQSLADDEEEIGDSWKCTFVHWLGELSLMVGYNTITEGDDEPLMASLHIWDLLDVSLQVNSSTDLGDVIPFFDVPPGQQHTFYASTMVLGSLENEQPMHMVFVAANVGNDVALIGKDGSSSAWSILEMEDSGLSTPVNDDDDFSFPIGIVLMSTGQLLLAGTDASISLYSSPKELSLSFLPLPPMSEDPRWDLTMDAPTSVPVSFAELVTPISVLGVTETSDDEPPEMLDEPEEEESVVPESQTGNAVPALPFSFTSSSLLSSTPSLANDESLSLPPEQEPQPSVAPNTLNPLELPSSIDESTKAAVVTDAIVEPHVLATSIASMMENATPDVIFQSTIKADEDTPSKLPAPESEMSETAAKAAKVFDELDGEKLGSLPSHRMEELLDALGEGFHGTELDDQVAIIDPDARGMLDRTSFIAWYVRLSTPQSRNDEDGSEASSSIDSEEEAEREEERENARRAFETISSDEGATIQLSDFPKLIESLNTTYCDEDHGKVSRKLRKGDKIFVDDFLNWYVSWIFGGDESTDDESAEPAIEPSASGWKGIFAQNEGNWRCESCMVSNASDVTECAACNTPRPSAQDKGNAEPVSTKVSASGWGGVFAQKEGNWRCESCMVSNDSEATECVACNTPRPSAQDKGNAEPVSTKVSASGWGGVFAQKEGNWRCESCMVSNDSDATPRTGHTKPTEWKAGLTDASLGSAIGSGGFFFGVAPAVAGNPEVSTASSLQSSKDTVFAGNAQNQKSTEPSFSFPAVSAGGFTFGTQASGVSSAGTGGFSFGTQPAFKGSGALSSSSDVPENAKVTNEEVNDKEDSIYAVDEEKNSFQFSALSFHQQSSPFTGTTPVAAAPPMSMVDPLPTKSDEKKTAAAAFPPMSLKAPTPVGLPPSTKTAPVAAAPSVAMVAPSPVEPIDNKSAAAFPPLSLKAPTPFGLPPSTKAAPLAAAPPMSMVAPSPIKAIENKTAAAFPPVSLKAPTPFGLPPSTKAAPLAAAPPMSMVAPSPIKPTENKTAAAFPPVSLKAPTPFGLPQNSKTASLAAAPPVSMVAPSPIEPIEKTAAAFPPMSLKAPTPIELSASIKTASPAAALPMPTVAPSPIKPIENKTASAFPPMSLKAPTPFGLPPNTRAAPLAAVPPMSSVAPSPVKPVEKKTATAFPPISAPLLTDAFPATTSFFSNKGFSAVSESAPAKSPKAPPFPSDFTMNSSRQPSSTVGLAFHAAPLVHGSSNADRKEVAKLTEYSQQYENLVNHMRKSLRLLATKRPAVNADDNLRRDIEYHVEALSAARADIVSLFGSLEEWKGMAACVLGKKADATRNVSESQRLIGELLSPSHKTLDDFSTEPLDIQSETRRRKLSARFMVTKRYLDMMKARLSLMSAMVTPQGGNALLSSTLSSYNDVKAFDEASSKIERKITEIASSHIPSPVTKALSTATRQSPMFPVRDDKLSSLRNVESSMKTLEMPAVKPFDLNSATWGDERKTSPSHMRAQPTRGSHTARLFSPTLSLKTRDGWSSSTSNQMKMKQVSFSPSGELRDTTLSFSSRDALSDYGTNPDKVQEFLTVNKRGMPSVHSTVVYSLNTSAAVNESPLKRQTAPVKEGYRTTTSQNKNSSSHLSGRDAAIHDGAYTSKSAEDSVADLSLSSTPKRGNAQPLVDAASSRPDVSSFGNVQSFGSNPVQQFSASPKDVISSQVALDPDGPDYLSLLTRFYEQHNPGKVTEASSHLEKYKGREHSLFAKLAKKYDTVNPLDSLQQSMKSEGQSTFQGSSSMMDDSSALTESFKRGNGDIASYASQQHSLDQNSSVLTHGMSASPFGSPFNATNFSGTMPISGQVGASTSFSTFGQGLGSSVPPSVTGIGSTVVPTSSFGGKSPRELLTTFYQEKNPSKIADVDNLLIKYQGREEEMFRNLAKKYSLDPTVFGLSATPSGTAVLATPPGIAPTPLAFGQPTPLGGGTSFGMGSPSAPSFGSGIGGFGQTFGSAAGSSPFGSTSFGALANAPVQPSFGGLASSQHVSSTGPLFGSPTPFGAPRR